MEKEKDRERKREREKQRERGPGKERQRKLWKERIRAESFQIVVVRCGLFVYNVCVLLVSSH